MFKRDPDEARRRLEAALARVSNGTDEDWKQAAKWAIFYTALKLPWFTADDLWETGLPKPREPRALGPVMREASRKGICSSTGRMVKSQSDTRNTGYQTEWRSWICVQDEVAA